MRPPAPRNSLHKSMFRSALSGRTPAEDLPQYLRWRVVFVLHGRGWTDDEIADHIMETPYTTARIRRELRLPPNP